ncbi:hypothetical protein [Acidovorax sp. SRB_14]|uniref:hypothetical protein n=2 Tax=unclassified Acidovorax TaxID=2684926 RepID=UPI00156424DA|nr:hypothetical protein [Acidovorax sp. SRB_14]
MPPALPTPFPSRSSPSAPPRWPRLFLAVALVAIAAQLLAMAQLAQHQVQRGVELRQTIAMLPAGQARAEPGAAAAQAQAQLRAGAAPLHTAAASPMPPQGAAGDVPTALYAQR